MLRAPVTAGMKRVFTDAGLAYGVEHTERVVATAEAILDGEGIDGATRLVTVLAALLHDVGAVEALRKHGSLDGRLQELEGPAVARPILDGAGVPAAIAERVCHLVGHHHTASAIDGPDFQALWEADTLEALAYEAGTGTGGDLAARVDAAFRTPTGRALARARLGLTR